MFIRTSLGVLALLMAAATPAQAVFCTDHSSNVTVTFGFHFGDRFDQEDQDELDLIRLRREGVDATGAERWNGCIRAFVRKPEGGEEMQFFDPNTYVRVY